MATITTVMDIDGLQPQDPTDLNNQLTTLVASEVPGYTSDLPGSLVEDLSGTGTGVIAMCDQARVELVNSLTPYGANQFILNQLGIQKGIRPGLPTNTSVYIQFTGTPGFVINQGFTVSDGTNQYVLQDTTVVPADGTTNQAFAVSTSSASFAVPANTVNLLVTGIPEDITLSVTNPSAGFPSTGAESLESYRARVLEAETAVAQGLQTTLKTNLKNIPGVQSRLVSVVQQTQGWSVVCGGGDQYAVAGAIFDSVFDVSLLKGSSLAITGITYDTTNLYFAFNLEPNFAVGSSFTIINSDPLVFNGTYIVSALSADGKTITAAQVAGTTYTAYVSGAALAANPRDISVTINDSPDQYTVLFITPPAQTVGVTVAWDTNSPNVVSDNTVAQAMQPAVYQYINSIVVGKPINVLQLQNILQTAVANIIPIEYLDDLIFTFTINGEQVTTQNLIPGDPEGYFTTDLSLVTVTRSA